MYRQEIAKLIYSVAKIENDELLKISRKGIMSCPELAFVYLVAKNLSIRSSQIFGQPQDILDWSLEKSKKEWNIRRLDLYIDPKLPPPREGIIPIEFKLGYKVSEWEKDVDKLLNIKNVNILSRMFCALLIEDLPNKDRIKNFEEGSKRNNLHRIGNFVSFRTFFNGKEEQCIIGIWEIK